MSAAFVSVPAMSAGAPASSPALFAARCADKPSSSALRAANRAAHLNWIASQESVFRFAGPMRTDSGEPLGSLIILSGESHTTVSALLDADPYAQAGLFGDVDLRRWTCGMAAEPPLPVDMYAVWCVDKPGMKETRKETRPRHLDWWRAAGRKGMIGPFPADDGDGAVGSLIVCEGESIGEVTEWAKTDPYSEVGLFEDVQVQKVVKMVEDGRLLAKVKE